MIVLASDLLSGVFVAVEAILASVAIVVQLAKECNEAIFNLVDEGPSVLAMKQLQQEMVLIENRQVH
jgi:hypothetical protein